MVPLIPDPMDDISDYTSQTIGSGISLNQMKTTQGAWCDIPIEICPAVSKFIDRATAKRGQYLSEVSFELNRINPI